METKKMLYKSPIYLAIVFSFTLILATSSANAGPSNFTYEGILTNDQDIPEANKSINVQLSIVDTSGCKLYTEDHTNVMTDTYGQFVVKVGTGTITYDNTGLNTFEKIFKNTASLTGSNSCASTATNRLLKVTVGGTDLNPDLELTGTPYSVVANQAAAVTDGLIDGATAINTTGAITTTGSISTSAAAGLAAKNISVAGTSANLINITAQAALGSNYTLSLPNDDGSPGQLLSTDGNGVLSWIAPAGGSGITSINTDATAAHTFSMGDTGTAPNITNGGGGAHTIHIPLANSAGVTSGTISKTEFDTFNEKLTSPLTTKGDLLSRDGAAHAKLGVGTDGQFLKANSAQTTGLQWTTLSIVDADVSGSANITATKLGTGIINNSELGYLDGVTSHIQTQFANKLSIAGGSLTGPLDLGANNITNIGAVKMNGTTSGFAGFSAPPVAGNNIWVLPSSDSIGYLRSDGSGNLSWGNPAGAGTVTNVGSSNTDISVSTGSTTAVLTLNAGFAGGAPDANKIAKLDGSGQLSAAMIPSLDASQINTGIFTGASMPGFSGDITTTSGTTIATITASAITDSHINVGAAIARSKLANSGVNHVLINDASGAMSSEAQLSVSRGGTGVSTLTNGQLLSSNGTVVTQTNCTPGTVLEFDVLGWTCGSKSTGDISQNGNSFGVPLTIGTNNNFNLIFETNGISQMTIDTVGKVGIGQMSPSAKLDILDTTGLASAVKVTTDNAAGYAIYATQTNNGGGTTYTMRAENSSASNASAAILAYSFGNANGVLATSTSGTSGLFQSAASGNIQPTLVTKRNVASTADLFQVQTDAGANLFKISSTGHVTSSGSINLTSPSSTLGVGTSAATNLHVYGTGNYVESRFQPTTGSASGLTIGISNILNGLGDGEPALTGYINNDNAAPVAIMTANTVRVLVNEIGNVGIGTPNPASKLQVEGAVKLGTNGNQISNMGICTLASTALSTSEINYVCTSGSIPAVSNAVIHCSPTAAYGVALPSIIFRASGVPNQISIRASSALSASVPWTCMWMMQ